jgi:integrase
MLWPVCRKVVAFFRGPRFAELAAEVLDEKRLLAPGTRALATIVLRRLVEHFGEKPLRAIAEPEWREYVATRLAKRPGCWLFDDKKYMSQVLALAVRRGVVARKIALWIPRVPKSGGRELQPAELRRLLKAARPELRFQIEVAYKMGLRRWELLSLKWEQFDWKARMVRVFSRKTGKERDVPINPDLFNRFRRRHRRAGSPCVFPGRVDPARPVLDNKTAWRACKREAKVKARWQDLRHTCATVMLRRGVPIPAAARMLGHGKRVLLEIYEHLNAKDLRRASRAMSDRRRASSRRRRRLAA